MKYRRQNALSAEKPFRFTLLASSLASTMLLLTACGGSDGDAVSQAPSAGGAVASETVAIKSCEAIGSRAITKEEIGLPTNGAVIDSAVISPAVEPYPDAEGEHLLRTPERCLVQGRIQPVDSSAPPIRFAINLPLNNWNRLVIQSGGGGLGGQLITAPGNKASGRFDPNPVDSPYPITRGYVTFGSDNGHTSTDFLWARNDEAMRNWAHDELKKTRDVAVAVVKRAYDQAPQKVFISGESAGGREAIIAAQRFPNDYDGVIATSPVLSWNALMLANNRLRDRLIDRGFLDASAIKLVADHTRVSCDADDGAADGLVSKYLECRPNVAALRCPDGNAGSSCLSDAQIAAVNTFRDPWTLSVPLANGVTRFPGYFGTGGEDAPANQWSTYPIGTQAPSNPLAPGRGFEAGRGSLMNFSAFWVRNAILQNEASNPYQFDPATQATRIQYLSSLADATNPDLSRFAARGGKMIILHPSADNATPLSVTAEYYRNVVARMGQTATDNTLRFYVSAGGSHNVGGPTQLDALSLLENWVMRGQTPSDSPTVYDKDTRTAALIRSLPACRYPAYPKYNGSGPVNEASSFTCTARPDPLAAVTP